MKTFEEYGFNPNDKIKNDLKLIFERQLQSLEGNDVIIDKIPCKVAIQQHTNPLNEEKEDRKMLVPNEIDLHRGSIVEWKNKKWIVINNVGEEDNNGVFRIAKIYPCTYTLKWLNEQGKIMECPCIATNTTMYSLGIKTDNDAPTIVDGKLSITLPFNSDTKNIKRDKRFLYHNSAYKVTFTDVSKINEDNTGTITFTLSESEINKATDNLELGIADYYNAPKYEIRIKEDDISISKDKTLQLNAIITKDGQVIDNSIEKLELIWESSNPSIATVDSNGLLTAVISGNANITVKLKNNENVADTILCNVRNVPVQNIEYLIQGDDSITWTVTKEYKAVKLVNGVEEDTAWNFSIDYLGNSSDLASMAVTGINTVKITANSVQKKGKIKLISKNKINSSEIIEKEIEIKGFW